MKKYLIWVWLAAAVFLMAACGAQPSELTGEPAGESSQPAGTTAAPAPTSQAEAAPFKPAASLQEALLERAQDYGHGGSDPLLTVIEYGDFQ